MFIFANYLLIKSVIFLYKRGAAALGFSCSAVQAVEKFPVAKLQPTLAPETIATPLDVESLRKLARNNEKYRNKSALEQINEKNGTGKTLEIRVADAVKRSERKICKTDYAAMGLLAVIPLAYGAITDEGCK